MSTLAARIARLPDLSVEELAAQYREVFGDDPPIRRRPWLWRRIAWKLQANELGGLPPAAERVLQALMADIPAPPGEGERASVPVPGIRRAGGLVPGTVLDRTYQGRVHRVTVLAKGVEYEGAIFSSLSAVAKHITGSSWNGRLFFGLTQRKRGRSS